MKTFLNEYLTKKNNLASQLENKTIPDAIHILREEMRIICNVCIEDMIPTQRQLALNSIGLLEQAYNLTQTTVIKPSVQNQPVPKNTNTMLSTVVSGSTTGLVTGGIIGGAVGFGIGAVTGFVSDRIASQEHAHELVDSKEKLTLDIDKLLSTLEQDLDTVDRILAANYQPEKKPSKPTLEDHRYILTLLQDLMGEEFDKSIVIPEFTRKLLKQIPALLRQYNIETLLYSPKQQKGFDSNMLFQFEPNLDSNIQEYITLKPAFVKEDRIILQGLILEPETKHKGDN